MTKLGKEKSVGCSGLSVASVGCVCPRSGVVSGCEELYAQTIPSQSYLQ